MEREANVEVLDFNNSQNIEVLVQEEVQLDINVPLFYIKSGEEDIKYYVTNHAKPEIDAHTTAAVDKINQAEASSLSDMEIAKNKQVTAVNQAGQIATGDAIEVVDNHANTVIIPQLQEFTAEAQAQATHAATSATDSEHYSEDSRIWAEGADSEVQGLGGVHSSKVWSEIAAESADRAEQAGLPSQAGNDGKFLTTDGTTASWSKVSGFYNRVHDCILENPRYIIWEQDGNTLTLKAGTKLWYPDGRSVVLENDISGTLTRHADLVWADLENNTLLFKDSPIAGPTADEYPKEHPNDGYAGNGTVFYDQTENKFKTSNGSAWVGDWTVPLPVKTLYNSTTRTNSLIIDESTFNKGMIVFKSELGNAYYIFIPEGIKTLACSGLKTDGSYNNVEYATSSVMVLDSTSSSLRPQYFAIKIDGTVQISNIGFKVTADNYLQNLSTNEIFSGVRLGNYRDYYQTNIYDTLDLQNSTRVFYWDD